MHFHLNIAGILLMALALMHLGFPKRFYWDQELKSLSVINRQMMVVHTFFVAFTVFLIGLLCLTSSNELIETDFGKRIALGLGVFWSVRLFIQFFGYSSELWKGKTFETVMHVLFSLFWSYLSVLFFAIYFN
jgi:hypothetical protein